MENKELVSLTIDDVSIILANLNLNQFIDIYKANEVDGNTLNACESVDDFIELGIKFKAKANVLFQKIVTYKSEGIPNHLLRMKKSLSMHNYISGQEGYELYTKIVHSESLVNNQSYIELDYFAKHELDMIAKSFIARYYHYYLLKLAKNEIESNEYFIKMNKYATQCTEAFLSCNTNECSDAYMQDNIGLFYQYGIGVKVNKVEAMKYYRLSALQGNAHALTKLGLYHLIGYEVIPNDPSEAIKLLQNALLLNYPKAFHYLSICYKYGIGVDLNLNISNTYNLTYVTSKDNPTSSLIEDDNEDVILLLQIQAQYKDTESLYSLGNFYEFGKGVPIDYQKALDYYLLAAAEQNHGDALFRLGNLFQNQKDDRYSALHSDLNAFHYYYLSSLLQHPEGTCCLGVCYMEGYGTDQDNSEAIRCFWLAYKYGSYHGYYRLAICYKLGHGITQNLKEALRLLQLAADHGNSYACLELGDWYRYGMYIKKDDFEAFRYYQLALKHKGDVNAIGLHNIGICYLQGIGVKTDELKGYQYCQEAADKGLAIAQYIIGNIFEEGKIIEKNEVKAFYYYNLAANQNYIEAVNKLGNCYLDGIGTKTNYSEVFRLYEIASNANSPIGQYYLGRCYQEGVGVHTDLTKAFKLYQLSANQDYDAAQKKLAHAYKDGIGTEQNLFKSFELFLILANKNYPAYQYMTGRCYHKGLGVEQDYFNSFKYFKLAADNGHAIAQNATGLFYATVYIGSVDKNYALAFEYYQLAAKQNNIDGLNNLGLFYYQGILAKPDYNKAFECFQNTANRNNPEGLIFVGMCYMNGKGVEKNTKEAFKSFQLAANQNSGLGYYNLSNCYKNGIGTAKNAIEATICKQKAIEYGFVPDSNDPFK